MQVQDAPSFRIALPQGELRIESAGTDGIGVVEELNMAVFGERRVIFRMDRTNLIFLVAYWNDTPVGYKVGYGEDRRTFYSAKGGVLDGFRRRGIALKMLYRMEEEARTMGYRRFAFDTFPNMHKGMTILGLSEGYNVKAAGYNAAYRDFRLRFEKAL